MAVRRRFLATAMIWLALSLCVAPAAAYSAPPGSLLDNTIVVSGGDAVLVEVYTATWCPSCAELDDILAVLRPEHDGRMALMTLHPTDGVDVLSTLAASHRLERLQTNVAKLTGTPTIYMECDIASEGLVSGSQFSSDLFKFESNLRDRTEMTLSARQSGDILSLDITATIDGDDTFANTQVAVMVGDDDPVVPDGDLAPGAGPYDATLHSLVEVEITNTSSPQYDAFPPLDWVLTDYRFNTAEVSFSLHLIQPQAQANTTTIIVTHEVMEEFVANTTVDTFAALSIIQEESAPSPRTGWQWLVGGVLVLGLLILADSHFRAIRAAAKVDDGEE
jgi:thiol-disulfide isomerase/thioredoxin